jgi:two-component system sensor kinase FixL
MKLGRVTGTGLSPENGLECHFHCLWGLTTNQNRAWARTESQMESGLIFSDSIIAGTGVDNRPDFAERLVRPLAFRFGLVFVAVACLLLVDQAVIQPLLVRLNGYAPIINLAGRQRMLSQKIAKQSLAIEFQLGEPSAQARPFDLMETVEQWSAAHYLLRDGDPRQAIGPITVPSVAAALRDLEPDFAAMQKAARQLSSPVASQDRVQLVRVILDHEGAYLASMERVVTMLESEARQQVGWLRVCALATVVLAMALLASLYAFVVRPATTLIRQQLRMLSASDLRHRALAQLLSRARDELEQRVAQRTSDLRRANTAIEREMAHRRDVEMRMRRLSADLAHASRITALGQLATGLAHELNQPLGAIVNYTGACELLLDNNLTDSEPTDHRRLRQAITEVKRSALRAGEIVRRMRNFVRRTVDQTSQIDLNDLVREVAELCEPELRRRGVEWTLSLSDDAIAVVADPIQLQQVLVNLVQNAIQAMREVDGPKRLGIRTSLTPSGAQVDVADSGPGFPDDGQGDSFTPFFSTKADGLGMGLSISRTIMEQHQGRIWAGNRPDGGAIVSFSLPVQARPTSGMAVQVSNLPAGVPIGSP